MLIVTNILIVVAIYIFEGFQKVEMSFSLELILSLGNIDFL